MDDCIDGIMLGYEKSSKPVNIFNLGLQEQTTVDELADIVIEEMGLSNVRKRYTGGVRGWIGDNPVVYLSIKRIQELGWKPRTTPIGAIRLTARWTLEDLGGRSPAAQVGEDSRNGQGRRHGRRWIPRKQPR